MFKTLRIDIDKAGFMEYINYKKLTIVAVLIILVSLGLNALFSYKWIVVVLWFVPVITVIENKYAVRVHKKKLSDMEEFWNPVILLYMALIVTLIYVFGMHQV